MRRYLTLFGMTVFLILGLTICLNFLFEPFEPLEGGLTRIGGYAEKDFGWHAPQAALGVAANGSFMTDPDILVLGDSFSMGNLWQSVVTRNSGKKVQSFELGRDGCIRNWLAHALNYPSATTIVIETVERVLLPRFRDRPECQPKTPRPFEMGTWVTATTRSTWPPEWHIARTFEVSLNTLEMQRHPTSTIRSNMAVNAPADSRCAKFSHRRLDRLLYYAQDEDKFQWKDSELTRTIANILQIQEEVQAHGKQFILIVVPDKLSIYRKCLLSDTFPVGSDRNLTASLIAAGVRSPDLLAAFQANVDQITDLYLPNDTHLSVNGYIFMGEKITQFLSAKSF